MWRLLGKYAAGKEISIAKKGSTESKIRNIHQKTRKQKPVEEKIRIVIEGLRENLTATELYRRESISQSQYYKWSKKFLEAGKQRLAGNTKREADSEEVQVLHQQNKQLTKLVTELSSKNQVQKKF